MTSGHETDLTYSRVQLSWGSHVSFNTLKVNSSTDM